jgi:hypothetical protein
LFNPIRERRRERGEGGGDEEKDGGEEGGEEHGYSRPVVTLLPMQYVHDIHTSPAELHGAALGREELMEATIHCLGWSEDAIDE